MHPIDEHIQNPSNRAPDDIIASLTEIDITHRGFDGETHAGSIIMHEAVADDIQAFFAQAYELGFPIAKVIPIHDPAYAWSDERSSEDNNSSGFNYRPVTGNPARRSWHGYGRAFDINPMQNMYVKYDASLTEEYRIPKGGAHDETALGTLYAVHPLVRLMKERGWAWGGDWPPESGRTDWQHFENPT